MRKLEWTSPAIYDLVSAGEYIAQENPSAAKRMAERVKETVEYLGDHPNLGRPGRLSDTKELVISGTPFIVVYWIRKGAIQILRLLHHAQRWP
ncbi:MAG: type II toxin-antitoxin system RelE/ParE family toxin [Proteobacteria bacterium]|nr:type II toxin-antitoxin system RelE/ParE family toxin [Pseudomonadota bacterium]MBU1739695.1 type II toxin-antitoxin system RelE/ParE family toxin [Pseudomonadota bacterium]